jgi:hypothetical protein
MPVHLPECCRDLDCQALSLVRSDDGTTFVCCGLYHEGVADPYRLCFRSATTDTMYDHDILDLLDIAAVIIRGLSAAKRLEATKD